MEHDGNKPTQTDLFETLGDQTSRIVEKLAVRSQTEDDSDDETEHEKIASRDGINHDLPFVPAQREAVEETWTAIRSTPRATRSEFKGWVDGRPARRLPLRADMKPGGKRRE